MDYNFHVLTLQGQKSAIVTSEHDFICAPFGFVPYRVKSSCECPDEVIQDFWRCVDEVLTHHRLSFKDYIRAVRAYKYDGTLCGEIECSN